MSFGVSTQTATGLLHSLHDASARATNSWAFHVLLGQMSRQRVRGCGLANLTGNATIGTARYDNESTAITLPAIGPL